MRSDAPAASRPGPFAAARQPGGTLACFLRVSTGPGYFTAVALFLVFYLCIAYSYNRYLYPLYHYMGAEPREIGSGDLAAWTLFALAAPFFCGLRLQRPGDFLLAILYLVVVPSALVLDGSSRYAVQSLPFGPLGGIGASVGIGILIVSCANLLVLRRTSDDTDRHAGRLPGWLLAANLVAVALIVAHSRSYFSFDFGGQYMRRLLARDAFPSGSLLAYYCSIFTQGLFPVFLGYGIYRKKPMYTLAGLVSVLVLWGASGQKYPFLVLGLVVLLMYWYRNIGHVPVALLPALGILVLLAGAAEQELFGYSYVNDYFLRRTFAVPSTLLGAAQLYVSDYGWGHYADTLFGALLTGQRADPLTFQIGAAVFHNPSINANVDFLALAWMQGGLAAAALEAAVVGALVVVLNRIYQQRRDVMPVCIMFLLATKIVEQSLLTALVSSGILLMIVAVALMNRRRPGTAGAD